MDEIYTWIRNIVIYMIMNTIIMNLLGNKSYKKYVSIVSGMILVLIVVSPLMKFMKLDENLDYYLQINDFAIETSDFKNDLNRMEEKQSDAIFAEYQDKIRLQVKNLLLEESVHLDSFHLTIDKNTKSSTFGEILRMDMTANMEQNEEEDKEELLQIDEIDIARIGMEGQEEKTTQTLPSPMEINIKNKLSDFYNIEQGNINISIQGG
ncbi:MAG: putative rane protein [Herbinix sp.]|nr:putative rane protein [Herbinix sp.]